MSGEGAASTASTASQATGPGPGTAKAMTGEQIVQGFKTLKGEQRALFLKLSELEDDLDEHKIVLETLKRVDENRKCFRLVGNVLCERTVKEVTPVLAVNKEHLTKVIASLNEQLAKKSKDIDTYKETYNIRVRGIDEIPNHDDDKPSSGPVAKTNVLVSEN